MWMISVAMAIELDLCKLRKVILARTEGKKDKAELAVLPRR